MSNDQLQEWIGEEDQLVTPETTDSQLVAIEQDSAIISLREEGKRLVVYAEGLRINGVAELSKATDDLSLISLLKKKIEDKRKVHTTPLNDELKKINAAFKEFAEPLLSADTILRGKVKKFNQEQEELQRKAVEANRKRAEAAQLEAEMQKETGEVFEIMPAPISVPEVIDKLYTQAGTLGSRTEYHWELTDIELLPRYLLQINEKAIDKMVKSGVAEIPGIRIWAEKGIVITPRKE